jgi:hypothetical protein
MAQQPSFRTSLQAIAGTLRIAARPHGVRGRVFVVLLTPSAEVPLQSPFSRHFVAHFVGADRVSSERQSEDKVRSSRLIQVRCPNSRGARLRRPPRFIESLLSLRECIETMNRVQFRSAGFPTGQTRRLESRRYGGTVYGKFDVFIVPHQSRAMAHMHQKIDFTVAVFAVDDRKVLLIHHRKLHRCFPWARL